MDFALATMATHNISAATKQLLLKPASMRAFFRITLTVSSRNSLQEEWEGLLMGGCLWALLGSPSCRGATATCSSLQGLSKFVDAPKMADRRPLTACSFWASLAETVNKKNGYLPD